MAPANAESKPAYAKDEKPLCFHGELLYEAKILDIRKQDPKDKSSPYEYRVHYKGWKNTYVKFHFFQSPKFFVASNFTGQFTIMASPGAIL